MVVQIMRCDDRWDVHGEQQRAKDTALRNSGSAVCWCTKTPWTESGPAGTSPDCPDNSDRSAGCATPQRRCSVYCLCIAAVPGRCHRLTLLFVTLFLLCKWTSRYCSADKWTNGPQHERSRVPGTKVPGNERSTERMFQERMVPRTKVPSWERMFQGTNSLENECSSIRNFS